MTSKAPRIGHLLETSLYVRDLKVSRTFYERVLGLECLGSDDRMCAFAVPGCGVLLLFLRGASIAPSRVPGGLIPPHDGHGTMHICFAVPVSQLDAWAAHLAACDVAVESRVRQTFDGTSLYFRDPDGHSVEVATPGLWETY